MAKQTHYIQPKAPILATVRLRDESGANDFALYRKSANPYSDVPDMWYVNKQFTQPQIEALSNKGFLVRSSGGVVRIEKYNCGAELRKSNEGPFQMTVIPAIMMQGQFTHLWDAGYQKFLLTHEGKKFPIRVSQLGDLRRFNEELRAALGVPTYYNEAIGSTCHYSVYDRVKGRQGDVPDETVGAHDEDGSH